MRMQQRDFSKFNIRSLKLKDSCNLVIFFKKLFSDILEFFDSCNEI